ncbi:hypothetical protein [Palleronia caenipelagi]|uniref:Uncharacterized protein n=1 Tax=Palleronia caenipelagi TaxID=2489174 RepID=A0A547PPS3_9RHOB|nr:hypothetical protein [Palleronia caenipelagi]TRD16110.1 hypothetical protein FEV53_14595 [Palleronia caenipelagi]
MVFHKGSRYSALPRFAGDAFKGLKPRTIPAATPVLEHTVALKDRLDALSQNYYRNPRNWTRLSEANPTALFAEDLLWVDELREEDGRERLGAVVLIPRREEEQK